MCEVVACIYKYKRRNVSKAVNHSNEQKFGAVEKANLLSFKYFICSILNPLLISPRELSLGYK